MVVAKKLFFYLFLLACISLQPDRGRAQIVQTLTNHQQHAVPLYDSELQSGLLLLPPVKEKRMVFTVHHFPDSQGNAYIIQNEGVSDTIRVHSASGVTHAGPLNGQDIFFTRKEAAAKVVVVSENDDESRVDLAYFTHNKDNNPPPHTASFSVVEHLNTLTTTFLGLWNYDSDATEFNGDTGITAQTGVSQREEQLAKESLIQYINALYRLIDILSGNILSLIAPEKYQSQKLLLGEQPAISVLCPIQLYPCDPWLDGPSTVHKRNWDEIFGHSPGVRKSPAGREKGHSASGIMLLLEAAKAIPQNHYKASQQRTPPQTAEETISDHKFSEDKNADVVKYIPLSYEMNIHPILSFVINTFISALNQNKVHNPEKYLSETLESYVIIQSALCLYKQIYSDEEAKLKYLNEVLKGNHLHLLTDTGPTIPEPVKKISESAFPDLSLPASPSESVKLGTFETSLLQLIITSIKKAGNDKRSRLYGVRLFTLMLKLFFRNDREQSQRAGLIYWLDNSSDMGSWRYFAALIITGIKTDMSYMGMTPSQITTSPGQADSTSRALEIAQQYERPPGSIGDICSPSAVKIVTPGANLNHNNGAKPPPSWWLPQHATCIQLPNEFWTEIFKQSFFKTLNKYKRINTHGSFFSDNWNLSFRFLCQEAGIQKEQANALFKDLYTQWLDKNPQ